MKEEQELKFPPYEAIVENIIPRLRVKHKKTGVFIPLKLKPNQADWLKLLCSGSGKYVCVKARQQGITTVTLVYLLSFALANKNVDVSILMARDDDATRKLREFKDFAEQLGYFEDRKDNAHRCPLTNGSVITCQTAAQKAGAGRSASFVVLMLSEFAHYDDPEGLLEVLTPTLALDGQLIIETTGSPDAALLKSVMYAQSTTYKRRFYGFESDPDFAIDETLISDRDFAALKEQTGITSRGHAAYFNERFTENKNLHGTLNEFPIKLHHAFQSSTGRYIDADPEVIEKDYTFGFRIFEDRIKGDVYLISVDVAGGRDRDSSAIAVLNQNGKLCASFKSAIVEIDELFDDYLTNAVNLYSPKMIIIETNYSREIEQRARRVFGKKGIHIIGHHTNDESKKTGLLYCKRAIEAGDLYGPIELHEEVLSLRKEKTGQFKGMKDLLMAIGFGLYHLEKLKLYASPKEQVVINPNVYRMPDFNQRKRWW